jgi:nucleotide-binding universal stress UspA family protein
MSLAMRTVEKEPPMDTQKILVAVDFTDSSDLAVGEARRLARQLNATIAFVHVAPLPPSSPSELVSRDPSALGDLSEPRARLTALVAACEREGIAAEPHLCVGSVVMGILDLIERLAPIMVVAGSHGKGRITRALVGSVAESLLRRSPVPVLVVPSPRRQIAARHAAWMCSDCGHILGNEGTQRCRECGANPAHWISAPISDEPIDVGEPAVGEIERETVDQGQRNDPAGLFATSPAGTSGESVNPELRVRY